MLPTPIRRSAIFLAFAGLLASCSPSAKAPGKAALWAKVHGERFRQASNHGFDPASPVEARVKAIPPWLLDQLRGGDGRWDYGAYEASADDRTRVRQAFELLPAPWQATLRSNLAAIYFVQNFWGGGYTEYLPETNGAVRTYMVLNAATLHAGLSKWMTWKDASAFLGDIEDVRVKIDAGAGRWGIDYVFVHEAAHVVDYARFLTPYAEPDLKTLYDLPGTPTGFTRGVWAGYRDPIPAWRYAGISNVSLYGFTGKPGLALSRAVDVYKALSKTPFVSLYASLSWAEDFADYCTYRILEKKLGRAIRVSVQKAGKPVFVYEPTRTEAVKARSGAAPAFD